jgi:type IV secretory pathway VirB4 component
MVKVPLSFKIKLMNSQIAMQVQHESDAWKRLLEFIEIEDNFLLNRLSSVLKESQDFKPVNGAESLQEKLIQVNTVVKLFQEDISELDALLLKAKFENGNVSKQVDARYKHLKNKIGKLETDFNNLKNKFNNFIADSL